VRLRIRGPTRPQVNSPRANAILDWTQTVAFIFWTLFTITLGFIFLFNLPDMLGRLVLFLRW
jgi:hypothetical protein